MAKLEDTISHFLKTDKGLFKNNMLIIIAIVFIVISTDILDDLFEDDNMWIWILLVILLVINYDDTYC